MTGTCCASLDVYTAGTLLPTGHRPLHAPLRSHLKLVSLANGPARPSLSRKLWAERISKRAESAAFFGQIF